MYVCVGVRGGGRLFTGADTWPLPDMTLRDTSPGSVFRSCRWRPLAHTDASPPRASAGNSST